MVNRVQRFRRDQSGITLLEGLISLPIMMITFIVLVELGWGLFQWSQAAKAVQFGARRLAVSTPVVTNLDAMSADFGGLLEGDPVPATVVSVSCGAGAAACDATELNRLVFGSDGICNGSAADTLLGMCDLMPMIQPANLRITYIRDGLGYVGRPAGPVLSIRVELVDLQFNYLLLGNLFGLNSLSIPPHPVTITSEDLSSCKNECP